MSSKIHQPRIKSITIQEYDPNKEKEKDTITIKEIINEAIKLYISLRAIDIILYLLV